MSIFHKNDDINVNSFLAVYHELLFSKNNKNSEESIDITRRCLALKYLATKASNNECTTSVVLQRGLKEYQESIDDVEDINNYWAQIKASIPTKDNDTSWKCGLHDTSHALKFVKSWSCQKHSNNHNVLPCRKSMLNDRHIENLMNIWRNGGTARRIKKLGAASILDAGALFTDINKVKGGDESRQVSSRQPMQFENRIYKKPMSSMQRSISKANFAYGDRQQSYETHANPSKKYRETASLEIGPMSKPHSTFPATKKESNVPANKLLPFKTAKEEMNMQVNTKRPEQRKQLSGRNMVNSKFVCPFKREKEKSSELQETNSFDQINSDLTDSLKNVDPKMIELIKNEIMYSKQLISWDNIAGLEFAKKIIKEVVVLPMLRPDIFTGLRRPPKGILLFGPPGTGKTLIGKCIASQSKATFFSISASSLTSKWMGEGEKMVRALFAVANVYQPSVVFIDEIDSLLSQRSETEHESTRRLKTEFLVQLDGAATSEDDRILIVGATNRPQELDEAARRRLVKRLYIPLPALTARKQIINNLMASIPNSLTEKDIIYIAEQCEGYSGADMTNLCKDASMGPIRSIPFDRIENVRTEDVREVTLEDFKQSLMTVRPSVSQSDLTLYVEWDRIYGSGTGGTV